MQKRYTNCSHGMSVRTIYSVFVAVAAMMAIVRAGVQPDLFDPLSDELMANDEDVEVMLDAADALQAIGGDQESSGKLRLALEAMDDLQREVAVLFDHSYDEFLALYPLWRAYVMCNDPVQREALFSEYCELLEQYEETRRELSEDLKVLLYLEQALLPSNAYADPTGRIPQSVNTAEVLRNFNPEDLQTSDDDENLLLEEVEA